MKTSVRPNAVVAQKTNTALANFNSLPDSAFVRLPVIEALFARSKASIYRDVAAGRLPAQDALGPRCAGWNVGKIRKALADLAGQA